MDFAVLQVNIRKQLRDFELTINLALQKEVTVLLGPSGHGKTTVLNMVAGIINPDAGYIKLGYRILFDSHQACAVRMEQRAIGFVFQDYALFPHMTVSSNVSYGLRAKGGLSSKEINSRVNQELERMDIASLRDAHPDQLSGGQRQRVALARTLVMRPQAMLLDEPLSALDMQLRARVRTELRSLLVQLEVPTIVVSHDPLDAIGLGDSIIVLERGQVVQQGSYETLLAAPSTEFVADFVESNAYRATFRRWHESGNAIVALQNKVELQVSLKEAVDDVFICIHPWDISLSLEPHETSMQNVIRGTVIGLCALRDRVRVLLDIGVPITAEISRATTKELGIERGLCVMACFKTTAFTITARQQ
jgi:molybdate transport system ATP-binding protein